GEELFSSRRRAISMPIFRAIPTPPAFCGISHPLDEASIYPSFNLEPDRLTKRGYISLSALNFLKGVFLTSASRHSIVCRLSSFASRGESSLLLITHIIKEYSRDEGGFCAREARVEKSISFSA